MSEPSDKARELVVALTGACMGFGNTGESEDLREANRLEAALLDYLASLEERAGEVLAEGWIGVIPMDGDIPIHLRDPEDDHRLYQGQPVTIVRRRSEEVGDE